LGSEAVSVNPRNKQLTSEVKTVISAALAGPEPSNAAIKEIKKEKRKREKEIGVRRTQRESDIQQSMLKHKNASYISK
jgi:hypothetical protein